MRIVTKTCDRCHREADEVTMITWIEPGEATGVSDLCSLCMRDFKTKFLKRRRWSR